MLEAIIETLRIMGWLGIILGILVIVNITTSTIHNIWSSKELFSWYASEIRDCCCYSSST